MRCLTRSPRPAPFDVFEHLGLAVTVTALAAITYVLAPAQPAPDAPPVPAPAATCSTPRECLLVDGFDEHGNPLAGIDRDGRPLVDVIDGNVPEPVWACLRDLGYRGDPDRWRPGFTGEQLAAVPADTITGCEAWAATVDR